MTKSEDLPKIEPMDIAIEDGPKDEPVEGAITEEPKPRDDKNETPYSSSDFGPHSEEKITNLSATESQLLFLSDL